MILFWFFSICSHGILLVRVVGNDLKRSALHSGGRRDPDGAGGAILLPSRGALVEVHRKNLVEIFTVFKGLFTGTISTLWWRGAMQFQSQLEIASVWCHKIISIYFIYQPNLKWSSILLEAVVFLGSCPRAAVKLLFRGFGIRRVEWEKSHLNCKNLLTTV